MIDAIGHIAYGILMLGTYLMTRGQRIGWLLRAVGDLIWAALGAVLGLTCVVGWCLVFVVLDVLGYYKSKNK